MNYFLLAETDFFRLINEAGDCNMETAYTAFATQVIELCNGGMDANLTVIALAYIEIELQHHPVRNLSEEKREIAAYVSKALSFVRKMQKFLATPQVPPLISANNATETTASLLQWTGNAIDLVELIYGIDVMGCINNGNMPLKQLAPLLYKIFGVDSKDCYRFYTVVLIHRYAPFPHGPLGLCPIVCPEERKITQPLTSTGSAAAARCPVLCPADWCGSRSA